MDSTFYTIIVALLAVIYSIIVRKIQYKYGNQKEMETLNVESKKLNEEYQKASAKKDKKEMEEIMAKQMALFKKMWGGVFNQFKIMLPILAVFFAFTWGVTYFDPTTKDDVTIDLFDKGGLCDETTNDGVYSTCYIIEDAKNSVWMAEVKTYKDGNSIGESSIAFVVGEGTLKDAYVKQTSGNTPPNVSTDKAQYNITDVLKLTAVLKEGNSAKAVLNKGTRFYVNLPFTIPLIITNIKTIDEASMWFIIIAVISGLLISLLANKVEFFKKWLS